MKEMTKKEFDELIRVEQSNWSTKKSTQQYEDNMTRLFNMPVMKQVVKDFIKEFNIKFR